MLGTFPTGSMAPEILSDHPDRMRALFVSMGNPARSWPDSKKVAAALDRLELLVVIHIVMSETAQHADYVLPGKTGFKTYEFNVFQATGSYVSCILKPSLSRLASEKRTLASGLILLMGLYTRFTPELIRCGRKSYDGKGPYSLFDGTAEIYEGPYGVC